MSIEVCYFAIAILILFAAFDLMVGVSNDAANFLNSSIGSRVAPLKVILIIASLGIIVGVCFSSGMMEVARKGIFHPQFFTMPELVMLFLAVMFTDVLLLDLFNTYGMPTSTTVSIVFELLGAAVAMSLIKVIAAGASLSTIATYINTAKALTIIFGILISIVVAFAFGAIVQFFARLAFTFDYKAKLKTWGGIWGGLALASITLFILLKGAKSATFISAEEAKWIKGHSLEILLSVFLIAGLFFQMLCSVFNVNVLKPIILIGTFALALAFAANDLVNFIGVPLAALSSFTVALSSVDPLSLTMDALAGKVRSDTYLLTIAGGIMVITLWFSKKARTVSQTEVGLARQEEEGIERFNSIAPARMLVRTVSAFFQSAKFIFPRSFRKIVKRRFSRVNNYNDDKPSFDLLRASVNLMVASAVISFATSLKLPLSTTYVTFMVAMGSSFSDQAWGRDTAVYRVTGVLTVIGGWFMTAFLAFSVAFIFAWIIHTLELYGILLLLALVVFSVWKTNRTHKVRMKDAQDKMIFNLENIKHAPKAIEHTYRHTAMYLRELRIGFDSGLEALFAENLDELRSRRGSVKKIETWSDIITANVYKVFRLLEVKDLAAYRDYSQTNRCLQNMAESYRDVFYRAYRHVSAHHRGLLSVQILELRKTKDCLCDVLLEVETTLDMKTPVNLKSVRGKQKKLNDLIEELNLDQIKRVRNRSSKTRLTILFYAIIGNFRRVARQNVRLLEIYSQSLSDKGGDVPVLKTEQVLVN